MKLGWALLGVASSGTAVAGSLVAISVWQAAQRGLRTGATMFWPSIAFLETCALVVTLGAAVLAYWSIRRLLPAKAEKNVS
jgi:hypothetical protein